MEKTKTEAQVKSSLSNGDRVKLTVPSPLDTCVSQLEKGYSMSHLVSNIRQVEEFHVTRMNKIDNNRVEFQAVYRTRKGKRRNSAFLSGVLQRETEQSTQVKAQVLFPIRSLGCLAAFFSPLIILAFLSKFALAMIALYAVTLIISYAIVLREYRALTPASLKTLSAILEGKTFRTVTYPRK